MGPLTLGTVQCRQQPADLHVKMTIGLRVARDLPTGPGQLVVTFGAPRSDGLVGVGEFGDRSHVHCTGNQTTGQTRCAAKLWPVAGGLMKSRDDTASSDA